MNKPLPKNTFKAGESGNPDGRPNTATGRSKPISGLRRDLTKLRTLMTKSLENIKASVEGENIDKETLNSSKWVVTTVTSMHRAAISEEKDLLAIREVTDPTEQPERVDDATGVVGEHSWRPSFTTKIVDFKREDAE